jgi:hypothetical protein
MIELIVRTKDGRFNTTLQIAPDSTREEREKIVRAWMQMVEEALCFIRKPKKVRKKKLKIVSKHDETNTTP